MHATLTMKPKSLAVRVSQIVVLNDFFGEMPIGRIGAREVDAYKAKRLGAGIKPVSVNNDLRALGTILAFAQRRDFTVQLPRKWEHLRERGKRGKDAWTLGEAQRIIDAAYEVRAVLGDMVLFAFGTGCRKGEIVALPWEHVHEDAAKPHAIIGPDAVTGWTPKDEDARVIPLPPHVCEMLRRRRAAATTRYVFTRERGTGPYENFPQHDFEQARAIARVKGGIHQARHTFATETIEGGGRLRDVQLAMGHADSKTTEGYVHPRSHAHIKRMTTHVPNLGPSDPTKRAA